MWCRAFKRLNLKYQRNYCAIRVKGKQFLDRENTFSRNVLLNLAPYESRLVKLPDFTSGSDRVPSGVDPQHQTNGDVVALFQNESKNAESEPVREELCSAVVERSATFSNNEIYEVLVSLSFWPFQKSPLEGNFHRIWKSMDNELLNRIGKMSRDEILYYSDLWSCLKLTRQSDFVYRGMLRMARNPSKLTASQLVQCLYYMNVLRTLSKVISFYDIEERLETVAHELTVEELGVALSGFFKTQNILHRRSFVEYVIDRLKREAKTVPEITLSCLMKVIRNSLHLKISELLPPLIDALVPELPRLTVSCSAQLALLASACLKFHPDLLTAVARKLVADPSSARGKDIEKIVYSLIQMGFDPGVTPSAFETAAAQLRHPQRLEEFRKYPKSLFALINYLTMKGIFMEERVAEVLDMSFIRNAYGKSKFMFGREVLWLDTAVELEHPEYTGPRLPSETRNYLSKRYCIPLPDPKRKQSVYDAFHTDVRHATEVLLKPDEFAFKYLIPSQSRADLVVRTDSDGRPISLGDDFIARENFTGPIFAPKDGGKWLALVILSRNMLVDGTERVTGETVVKIRQLNLLGFTPKLINPHDWPTGSLTRKVEHIRQMITK